MHRLLCYQGNRLSIAEAGDEHPSRTVSGPLPHISAGNRLSMPAKRCPVAMHAFLRLRHNHTQEMYMLSEATHASKQWPLPRSLHAFLSCAPQDLGSIRSQKNGFTGFALIGPTKTDRQFPHRRRKNARDPNRISSTSACSKGRRRAPALVDICFQLV
jgi:hypothetical protein